MKTIVAETVMLGREAFETLGDVEVIPDRIIGLEHLQDADALIIRSKTNVTPELLEGSSVRFVGTATAGFEHIDFQTLEEKGIGWCASPGCNADSVADYVTAALLHLPIELVPTHKSIVGCSYRLPVFGKRSLCGVRRGRFLNTGKRRLHHSTQPLNRGGVLEGKTLGVIGVGQVGSRVAKRAEALGLRVLLNDPPRAAREFPMSGKNPPPTMEGKEIEYRILNAEHSTSNVQRPIQEIPCGEGCPKGGVGLSDEGSDFSSLETLLAQSDIVTMHVPLITEKPWPTLQMADSRFFEKMKRGSVFINASRGKVLDSDALLHAKENGIVSHAVLDVWDPEPCIRLDVQGIADIGTAHIAGHSLEGKLNGTVHVYREACHFFEIEPTWDPAPFLPAIEVPELEIDPRGKSDNNVMAEAVAAVYDIAADDTALRDAPETFDTLRANYGVRREFFNTRVTLSEERPELVQKLRTLGFQ